MNLNKKQRKELYEKYGGKCAYCGIELPEKWHADHLKPVERHLVTGKTYFPERDTFENLMPSCPSCNIHKHSDGLEEFRRRIAYHIEALNKNSTQYKFVKKFGLIQETGKSVEFYFEYVYRVEKELDKQREKVDCLSKEGLSEDN